MIRTSGKYHKKPNTVWLIYYLKKSNVPSLSWNGAVDEALCFSWIDSTQKKINDFSFMQFLANVNPEATGQKKMLPISSLSAATFRSDFRCWVIS
jgi:uncharacterized protein YdeI (YjbR/CyaY-like superfamily)